MPEIPASGHPGVTVQRVNVKWTNEHAREVVRLNGRLLGHVSYLDRETPGGRQYGWRADLPNARGLHTKHEAIQRLLEAQP